MTAKTAFRAIFLAGFCCQITCVNLLAQWSSTTLLAPMGNVQGGSAGSKVFFTGDVGGSPSSVVDVYDDVSETWSTAQLSLPKLALSITSISNKIFFAGGFTTNGIPSSVIDIYNATADSWSTAALSVARYSMGATTLGTKTFFAGGIGGTVKNTVDIFDDNTSAWSTATLSAPRVSLAAAGAGTKVLFAGGYDIINNQQIYSNAVDIYDVVDNTWTTATLSQARGHLAAAAAGTKVLFVGGAYEPNTISNVIDIYDVSTGNWSTATLSHPRSNLAAVTVGTKVFFAGGADYNSTVFDVVDIYDAVTDSWSSSTLSYPRNFPAAASLGTKAFFGGGYNSGPSDVVDIYETSCTPIHITAGPHSLICPGKSAVLSASGATNYTWTPSTGLSAVTGSMVTASPITTTTYLVRSADGGCGVSQASVKVTVGPGLPVFASGPGIPICPGSSTNLSATGASTYTWSPSMGLSATTGSVVTASPSVTTTYTVTGTDLSGCQGQANVTVVVGLVIAASPSQTICQGSSLFLFAGGNTPTVTWSPPDGLSWTTGSTVIASPATTTTYTVTGSSGGGCDVSTTVTVTVDPCQGWSVDHLSQGRWSLAGTSVGDKVLFGGGSVTGFELEAGNYSNVVDIYNNSSNSWTTATLSRARTELAATSVGSKAFFAGGHHEGGQFGTTSSAVVDIYDNSNNSWSTASLSRPRHELAAASTGTKAFFGGGFSYENSYSDAVDIYDNSNHQWTTATLSVARTELTAASVGTKVLFAGGIGPGQIYSNVVDIYDNSTGNWTTATLSQPKKFLTSATVGTKVFFAGGRLLGDIQSNVVDIYDNSTGQWTTATLSQARDHLAATAVGTKVFFGGGYYSGALSNVVDIYDNSTNTWTTDVLSAHRASLAAASVGTKAFFAGGHGLESTVRLVVDVFDLNCTSAQVSISPPVSICLGISTELSATGANSYIWSPSTGLSATSGSTVTASPSVTTTYEVIGDHGGGCTSSATVTVTVLPSPNIFVSPSTDISMCTGLSATLVASGADTYTWSPSNGLSTITGNTVIANPTSTTTYTVHGADGNGCGSDATVTITVHTPAVIVSPSLTICSGTKTTLEASGAETYTWSPSNGLSAVTGNMVTASPTGTIIYTVHGTDANGCGDDASVTVTVSQLPTVTVSPSISICAGTSATLAASGASTYTWSPLNGLSAVSGNTITANPAITTTYTVHGTDANGCENHATVTVTPRQRPTVTVSHSITICSGTSTALAASGANTYAWTPSSGLSGTTGAGVNANPSSPMTYTVTGTDVFGCTNSASTTVNINLPPKPVITSVFQNSSLAFLTSSVASGNQWFKDGSAISGATNSTLVVMMKGVYSVQVTENGCTGAMSDNYSIVITALEDSSSDPPFAIYPNPANDKVLVVLSAPAEQDNPVQFVDMLGRVMMEDVVEKGVKEKTIRIDNLNTGIYLMDIKENKRHRQWRLIITR